MKTCPLCGKGPTNIQEGGDPDSPKTVMSIPRDNSIGRLKVHTVCWREYANRTGATLKSRD